MKYRFYFLNNTFYINELALTTKDAAKLNEKLTNIAVNRPKSFYAKESDDIIAAFYLILSKPRKQVFA